MISTEEAKKISDEITGAASALCDMSKEAAERGVVIRFETMIDHSVEYPYHHICVEKAAVDLNWRTPDEIQKLADEMEEDD